MTSAGLMAALPLWSAILDAPRLDDGFQVPQPFECDRILASASGRQSDTALAISVTVGLNASMTQGPEYPQSVRAAAMSAHGRWSRPGTPRLLAQEWKWNTFSPAFRMASGIDYSSIFMWNV